MKQEKTGWQWHQLANHLHLTGDI